LQKSDAKKLIKTTRFLRLSKQENKKPFETSKEKKKLKQLQSLYTKTNN